jgi:ABC-type dipeptide/oligopeptide/nickel transport system ATPase component
MKRVVLIHGKQGSGKTTLANEITRQLKQRGNVMVGQFIFADTIYTIHNKALEVLKLLGILEQDVVKDGDLLQLLGTWGRNKIHPDVWCKTCKAQVELFLERTGGVAIIADARRENEFHTFPDALRISLNAPEDVRKLRTTSWRENTNHESEIGLDNYSEKGFFDMYFNTSTEDVEHQATLVIAQLLKNSWLEKRTEDVCIEDSRFYIQSEI